MGRGERGVLGTGRFKPARRKEHMSSNEVLIIDAAVLAFILLLGQLARKFSKRGREASSDR
jgi:hypothetical protein